jgi:hypothetical protein
MTLSLSHFKFWGEDDRCGQNNLALDAIFYDSKKIEDSMVTKILIRLAMFKFISVLNFS